MPIAFLNIIGFDRFLIVCASPDADIADIDSIEVSIFSVPRTRSFQETTDTPATDDPKLGTATDTFSETLKAVDVFFEERGIAANVNSLVMICIGSLIAPIRDAVILLIILTICVIFLLVVLLLILSDDTSERIFKISVAPERDIFCGICGQMKDGVGVCVLDRVGDGVCTGTLISVSETDTVAVAVDVVVDVDMDVTVTVTVTVSEADGVSVSEADGVPVSEADGVSVPETNVVRVIEIDGVHVIEALRDLERVLVILDVTDDKILWVDVRVSLTLAVDERVIEAVRDDVLECDLLPVEVEEE